jgi:hypothetical protein
MKVRCRHFAGGSEDNHDKPLSVYARFESLMTLSTKCNLFCGVNSCSFVEFYIRLGGTYIILCQTILRHIPQYSTRFGQDSGCFGQDSNRPTTEYRLYQLDCWVLLDKLLVAEMVQIFLSFHFTKTENILPCPQEPGSEFYHQLGRAITQAVSRRLPIAAARVGARVRSCGICDWHSGNWAGFLRVFRFRLPIRISLIAPHLSSSIMWGWYNRQNSGRSTKCTQSHPMRRKVISQATAVHISQRIWFTFRIPIPHVHVPLLSLFHITCKVLGTGKHTVQRQWAHAQPHNHSD